MMKLKIWVILTMLTCLLSVSVLAAPASFQTVLSPSTSELIRGTYTFKVEVNGTMYQKNTSGGGNLTNATFFATPSVGSRFVLCTNVSNSRNFTLANWTCEYTTATAMFDTLTYTITAEIGNSTTANINSSQNTGVTVDNTVPQSVITSPAASASVDQAFSVTASCANSTSAYLFLGGASYAMTVSGSNGAQSCSYTFAANTPPFNDYSGVYVGATDLQPNLTSSSVQSINVRDDDSGFIVVPSGSGGSGGSSGSSSVVSSLAITGAQTGSGFGMPNIDWLAALSILAGILLFTGFLPAKFLGKYTIFVAIALIIYGVFRFIM